MATGVAVASAIAAICSVMVAVVTLLRTQKAVGVQTVLDMYTGWDAPRLRGARSRAAKELLARLDRLAETGADWREVELPLEASDVLNYLEIIGVLVCDAKIARPDEAWAAYWGYVLTWFAISRPDIDRSRAAENDLTILSSVERLYETLSVRDAEQRTAAARQALRRKAAGLDREASALQGAEKRAKQAEAGAARAEAKRLTMTFVEPDLDYLRALLEDEALLPDDREPVRATATLDPATSIEVRVR